jgi:hypothetical protein
VRTVLARAALVAVVAVVGLGVLPSPPAGACSCAGPASPEAAVAAVEVAFVGTVTSAQPGRFVYEVHVESVARGDDLPAIVTVTGADASGGCGPDYGRVGDRVAVLGERERESIAGRACSFLTPADLEKLDPQPPPASTAPVAAVAAFPYRWANVVALDAAGAVVSSGRTPFDAVAVAPCHGTSEAIVVGSDPDGGSTVAEVLDLTTMQVTGARIAAPDLPQPWSASFACAVIGGERVLVAAPGDVGAGGFGRVQVAGPTIRAEAQIESSAVQVIGPDGRVVVAPSVRGVPLRSLDPGTLATASELDLGNDVVADVALDDTGSHLALLVVDAEAITYQQEAHAVRLVDIVDGRLVAGPTVPLADGPGWANRISWVDGQLLVDRELFDGRHYELVALDGTVVASEVAPVGGGSRVVDIGAVAVTFLEAGLVALGPDLTTTTLIEAWWGYGRISAMRGGPVVPPSSPPEHLLHPLPAPGPGAPEAGGGGGSALPIAVAGAVLAGAAAVAVGARRRRT